MQSLSKASDMKAKPTSSLLWMALLFWLLVLSTACSGRNDNNATQSSSECARGQLDCACGDGNICSLGEDGAQLACVLGVCEVPPCEAGSAGCACAAGSCGEGLECSSASGVERCEVTGCELGSKDCGCQLDRSCGDGLSCQQGTCQQLDCTTGSEGCACSKKFVCSSGLDCDFATQACSANVGQGCTPGNEGCFCGENESCVGSLECSNNFCSDPACKAGLEGCACLDGKCGMDTNGDPLSCEASVCQSSSCKPGDVGCVCLGGTTCTDEGVSCDGGYCKSSSCIPGSMGCDCLAGSCNPGLKCENESICVDRTGKKGGPCLDNGTCDRNNKCDDSVSPAACVYCDLGSIGCQCSDDESCSPGLECLMGHCVGNETVQNRVRNTDASCYTPCTDNLVTETQTRACVDGFLEGCIGDAVCDKNSCVKPGSQAQICFEDTDCPSYQLCMQGYCYVECDSNAECADTNQLCHDKVCRDTCTVTGAECGSGYVCELLDGEVGFCMIAASETGLDADVPSTTQGFELSQTRIAFAPKRDQVNITLYNKTDNYVNFTFRSVEQNLLYNDGTTQIIRNYDADTDCAMDASKCPLKWIQAGELGKVDAVREFVVKAPPNCNANCPQIAFKNPEGAVDATRWHGVFEVHSDIGTERIDLSFASSPQGRWAGRMVYFANFDDNGIDTEGNITGWLDKANRDDVSGVGNGLIQKWGAFRTNNITGGWKEMKAVLSATRSGQWKWPSVVDSCGLAQGACYLYDAGPGASAKSYVTLLDSAPIPTGVTEFPMAINIYTPDANSPTQMEGRVVTETALHYADDPKISLSFSRDPTDATNGCVPGRANCINYIDSMDLKVHVGGRYNLPATSSSCAAGFEFVEYPWLVPGFLEDAYQDPLSGLYRKGSCLDGRLPFYPVGSPEELVTNMNLARGNPIPDGRVLERDVEILDGALIDQSELFIIFRERYPSFLGGDDIMAYGYMVLTRQAIQIEEDDADGDGTPDQYEGATPPSDIADSTMQAGAVCTRSLLDQTLGTNVQLTSTNAPTAITRLIKGGTPSAASLLKTPSQGGNEEVHYLCEETGLFDGGPDNTTNWGEGSSRVNTDACSTSSNGLCEDGGEGSVASSCVLGTDRTDCNDRENDDSCVSAANGICEDGGTGSDDEDNPTCLMGTDLTDCGYRYEDTRVECPTKSNVIFFTTNASLLPNIHAEACQLTGTCLARLNSWISSGSPIIKQVEPKWICEGDSVFCDDNTLDRRSGKSFYKKSATGLKFLGLRAEMEDAFRYKTRFQSRDGDSSVGFTPSICEPFSTTTPYCYDPKKIEGLRERADCLLDIYDQYYDSFNGSQRAQASELYTYLEENFSYRSEPQALGGAPRIHSGFERLYAELLIMMGDDAYTSAFESRFDLAGSLAASFEGSKFEADGIDLSGVAGYEIFKLYQAVQYYDMVLNRFYSLGGVIGASLASGDPGTSRNFISTGTVTYYFDRLIRASTQRSRALSEIARRYQAFNRADLARRVAERAYTATYIESAFLANLILRFYEISGGSQRPQILAELEKSQLRYRAALIDLNTVYGEITSDINFFGFPADYVPFPALDNTSATTAESNAFEKVMRTALSKMEVDKTREQNALQQTRTYDTDEASFQAELTRITRTYENQLAEICGTFIAQDGLVYPAVERYAYLDERLSLIGDPCGFPGNGGIHRALGELKLANIEVRRLAVQAQNIYDNIDIEVQRTQDQCELQVEIADYNYKVGEELFNLEEDKISTQQTIDYAMRQLNQTTAMIEIIQCEGTECAAAGPALGTLFVAGLATEVAIQFGQASAAKKREEKSEIQLESASWNTSKQCDAAIINRDAATAQLMLGLRDVEISTLAASYRIQLAMSEVVKLRNQATRLEMEWQETLDTSVNVEAAKNDPNIRIYRNDSVINADIAFEDAMREAYRLTVVYEYYTSTTYATRDQLFLIRMVSAGDYNLENYLYDLRNAFINFEESFGIPELRVEVISLRDDIFDIPLIDNDGKSLSIDERATLLRERLQDPGLLNSSGYLAVPFNTTLERLSPLTRNHKIFYIESNIEGNDNGDYLGRLYLRQVGTSTIRSISDELQFYRFPTRTAVVNPFFNGIRQFSMSNELYRSYRLREFPLVNTDWELIINQRDEVVNKDINLNELTDIKLYVFYTDFTVY